MEEGRLRLSLLFLFSPLFSIDRNSKPQRPSSRLNVVTSQKGRIKAERKQDHETRRQTDRQTDRQTERQTNKKVVKNRELKKT
jgi:hypothetical protein